MTLWLNRRNRLPKTLTLLGCVLSLTITVAAQQQSQKSAEEYAAAGLAAQQAGKHEEALQHYSAALKLNPKHFGAQFNSGVSYMILRKFEDALTAFKSAAALRPDDPHVQFAVGKATAPR